MTPTRIPGRLRTSIQITLAAVTAVCLATAPGARAAPISYTLTPPSGATATFASPSPVGTVTLTGTFTFDPSGPTRVTLTGTFTFDPSGPTLDAVDITATGPTTILAASPDVFTTIPAPAPSGSSFFAMSSTTDDALLIGFANTLTSAPDPIIGFFIANDTATGGCSTTIGGCTADSVSGDATPSVAPPPSVVEPASLALLGGALGLFLLTPGAIRRYRQTRPDQPAGS